MTKILAIDDDIAITALIELTLTRIGYQVLVARDAESGLKIVDEEQPDLIICDIRLPGIDGYEVLKKIRENLKTESMGFIFLTAMLVERENQRHGIEMGADDYIVKPFQEHGELLRAVEAIMKRRERILRASLVSSQNDDHHYHAFLSYSRKDTTMMQRIRDDLRLARLRIWVAEESIEPGTPGWEQSISESIRSCSCLIVILTPDAEQSKWVGRELALAEILDKRIFPILARGTERDAIPFRLMSHQYIDARHDYKDAMTKLLAVVRKHLNLT